MKHYHKECAQAWQLYLYQTRGSSCRLASLNAMAAESWDPQIFLWQEPEEEAMAGLTSKRIGQMGSDQTFNMYHTSDYGQLEIMQLLESEHFFSYEVRP